MINENVYEYNCMFKLRKTLQYVFNQTLRCIVPKFRDTSLIVRMETPKNIHETFKMYKFLNHV